VTRCGGMTMLAGGEATLRRRNGVNDTSWSDVNLTGLKNKENLHNQFSWYKWTVKI
jgi:hypothetical protein